MKKFSLILFLMFMTFTVSSQEKYTKHIISQGETINHIARKYNIEPSVIFKLNPDANKTLQLKQVLLIPIQKEPKTKAKDKGIALSETPIKNKEKAKVKTQDNTAAITDQYHLVLPKETIYGITKKYNITAEALFKANPLLETEGLKQDQKIVIPTLEKESKNGVAKSDTKIVQTKPIAKTSEKNSEIKNDNVSNPTALGVSTEHVVVAKETKYGIAKKYGISVAELEKENPEISNQLPVGFKLKINNAKVITKEEVVVASTKEDKELKKDNESKKVNESVFSEKNYNSEDLALKLIETATNRIGTRYRSGGTSEEGFDCSGLVYSTFSAYDIKLPRSSFDQSFFGTKIDNKEVKKGDLIFFKTNGRGRINHVGLVVEVLEDEIKFVHSSTSSGVIISSTKESYYERTFAQVNRVL
jgi:cell wall-associated NlpC family hydrolase